MGSALITSGNVLRKTNNLSQFSGNGNGKDIKQALLAYARNACFANGQQPCREIAEKLDNLAGNGQIAPHLVLTEQAIKEIRGLKQESQVKYSVGLAKSIGKSTPDASWFIIASELANIVSGKHPEGVLYGYRISGLAGISKTLVCTYLDELASRPFNATTVPSNANVQPKNGKRHELTEKEKNAMRREAKGKVIEKACRRFGISKSDVVRGRIEEALGNVCDAFFANGCISRPILEQFFPSKIEDVRPGIAKGEQGLLRIKVGSLGIICDTKPGARQLLRYIVEFDEFNTVLGRNNGIAGNDVFEAAKKCQEEIVKNAQESGGLHAR